MGKVAFYAGFVSLVVILSQRLVMQAHYNDTLPNQSNVLQKMSWLVLLRFDIETIMVHFTIPLTLEVCTGRTD